MTRTLGRRTGERKQQVLELDRAGGRAVAALDPRGQAADRGRAPARPWPRRQAKLRQIEALELFGGAQKVAEQIHKRDARRADHGPAGLDLRPGRQADPQGQARQAERVRVRGADLRGDREHQARRAGADHAGRAPSSGNPAEDTLLPDTVAELERLGISPREVALDGGFNVGPTHQALEHLEPERTFIAGRQQPGSRRTQRRLARYRTGSEGRISHLKRRYGLHRIPAQRRPRDADLDRMVDPHLQP